jgi:hypothetical protein
MRGTRAGERTMASHLSRTDAIALGLLALWLTTFAAAEAAAQPARPQLVPLRRDQVPPLPPGPTPPPSQPPMPEPSRTPYPPPGYARWYLPPAPPDYYLNDLPPETEGRHTGFFMRLALGPGYYSMWSDTSEGSMALRAAGGGLNLMLGGAAREDLVLYGEIALQSTLDPDVDSYAGGRAEPGTSVTTLAAGLGVGYFLMPTNVLFAATVLVAQARAVDRPTERLLGKTDLGPALALSISKDWWMAPSWTIGVQGRTQLARLRDPKHGRAGAMWGSFGLSLAFCIAFE